MRYRKAPWAAAVLALGSSVSAQSISAVAERPTTQPAAQTQPTAPTSAPAELPPPVANIPNFTQPATTIAVTRSASAPVVPLTEPSVRPAVSETQATQIMKPPPTTSPQELGKRTVTANVEREAINPALGAVEQTFGPAEIANIPGGENAPAQQVLLRMAGVVEDSYGQVHIRGEHANLTYRVNGVLLPQPVAVFGQELDTRLINTVSLIDGALPAQFGFHTAGIVDVTTKTGASLNHSELTLYGGWNDTIQPSFQLGGTAGKLDYFVTASSNHNGLGIENTMGNHVALHDETDQERLFTYLSYHLDSSSRLTLFMNSYYGEFQIPDSKGLPPLFALAGHARANSDTTNENQNEQEYYSVVAYQKSVDKLNWQLSGFTRYGQIAFRPDFVNDLIFQGVSAAVYNSFITYGAELDSSYEVNEKHTIRAGLIGDYTTEKLGTSTGVFAANANGVQSSDVPMVLGDHSGNEATEAGIYLQDEWKLSPAFTLNYGVRYDRFDANFDHEGQLSPRVNAVYAMDKLTTLHAGYSRYFVPPPVQNLAPGAIAKFNNTTNAAASPADNAPKVERSDYYDVGVSRQMTPSMQFNLDGFYKQAHQLVDLGQFGDAVILAPFNYKEGTVYGAELSANYKQGGFAGFANFSWVRTMAHDIDTQQFFFAPNELAYIQTHNIKLDHEAEYTISAGASYAWRNDRVYVDFLYGSGLRAGFANTRQEPQYYPVNIGGEHIFRGGFWGNNNVRLRMDLINVFDQSYQLRQGGGLGVNANQYGQRRAVYAGMTYEF